MIRDAIAGSHSSSPNSKAVARKVSRNPSPSQNLSYPAGQRSVGQWAGILEQEQGASRVPSNWQVGHNQLESTERIVSPANVDETAFAERVCLGRFYPNL